MPATCACSNRFGSVGGSSAYPVTSAPSAFSHSDSQLPLKPVCPVRKTRRPFQKAIGLRMAARQTRRSRPTPADAGSSRRGQRGKLFVPRDLRTSGSWSPTRRRRRTKRPGPSRHLGATRSPPKGRSAAPMRRARRRVVDQAVSAEPADPVEALAGFQIALGDGHHFADGTRDRRDRRDRDGSTARPMVDAIWMCGRWNGV